MITETIIRMHLEGHSVSEIAAALPAFVTGCLSEEKLCDMILDVINEFWTSQEPTIF